MEAMKSSIADNGILQPLLLRWDEERRCYIIVAGERRWRCAKELHLPEIPCRVIEEQLEPAQVATLQLIENLIREDLNPMDEARGLKRLQELLGCTREDLSVQVHRSTASICRFFKLLDLPVEVHTLIELGRLPVSIAAELHRCPDPLIQRELAEKVAIGQMNRDDVTAAVRTTIVQNGQAKPKAITLNLDGGLSLRVPPTVSLKECEGALSRLLRQLREAKQTVSDIGAFVQLQQPNCSNG
jgi:ParB family chromosome partitioning protein